MPRDARATRERLLRAGARLFAAEGVDAARTRDIVALAGQGNDSAITYHFGSRRGLLEAVLRAGVDRMEPARLAALPRLDPSDLRGIVAAVVEPIAGELRTEEGRDFLRVVAQVSGRAGIRGHAVPGPIEGTAIARQLALLEECCLGFLPAALALERIAVMIAFLAAALADRTGRVGRADCADRAGPAGGSLLGHDAFVVDLIEMLTAALAAPHRAAPDGLAQAGA
ncbi:TetR/AcrR family transcriptional regulator [Spirillospora sp. NBC_01491]|uniref:TetR/AcrR family transcriptional regulator n=1 Tax=Spirillospora sp. NBC_01491 TaxID=2976007 RepID=UPI002E35B718|nr:TetR family transcriptional regulator [Spirillospora sp. NBC_01491]